MKIPLALALAMALSTLSGLSGCTAVVAGAAAAGGYVAHDKGYRVRNPVTKTDSASDSASSE